MIVTGARVSCARPILPANHRTSHDIERQPQA